MKNVLLMVIAALSGAVLGFVVPKMLAAEPQKPAEEEVNPLAAKLQEAEAKIAQLENELASAKAKGIAARMAAKRPQAAEGENAKDGKKDGGESNELADTVMSLKPGDDLMEKLKGKVPDEELAQMHDVFEKMRAARANRAAGRLEFLKSVDTSGMTEQERSNHKRLQELLAKREELAAKMQPGTVPDFTAIAEIAQIGMEMEPIAKQERSALIRQTGRTLGYAGDDVEVFHDTMIDVYDATSSGGALGTLNDMFNPGDAGMQMPMMAPGGQPPSM
ncbi:MAG: hypothetical protein IJI73_04580 [Kiritimatiellae bacterium]|nr:hypothetical protein [Kiritimatiellia bacterium]